MGGTHAHLPIDEELKVDVERVIQGEDQIRAFKVVVGGEKGEKLVNGGQVDETDSIEEDFAKLAASLDADKPCIALVRLNGSKQFEEKDWAMILYTPDSAPVKARMMNAASKKPLAAAFKDIKFTEYQVTEVKEVNLKDFLAATKEMTKDEKLDCMTQEERDRLRVTEEIRQEQLAAPKKLAGLVALKIKPRDDFNEAVKTMMAEEGKAVLGRLCGDKNEELSGEVLGASKPSELKGKLPKEEPCYALTNLKDKRVLLMTWLPEDAPGRLRMKCATFKASIVDHLKTAFADSIDSIALAEITEEDDLEDNLGEEKAAGGYPDEDTNTAPAAKPKFKPPCGGFKMPGMG